jgi:ferritin-like metal-binding protein YciE
VADLNARDQKLVQYLNEAYGKEKELETALTADISLTTDKAYRKRLQDHLKETRNHARLVKGRIKALGGVAEEVSLPGPDVLSDAASGAVNLANRAVAAAKGPGHMLRGTGEQEKLLKNAKSQYWNEFEEIATYFAIETFAEVVGDKETRDVAKQIRREEERMARFLERLIPKLARATAREEVPAALRNGGGRRRRSSRRRSSSASSNGSSSRTRTRAAAASRKSSSSSRKSSASKSRKSSSSRKSSASKSRKSSATKSRATKSAKSTKARAKTAAKGAKKGARSAAKGAKSAAKTARTSAKAAKTAAKRSRAGAKGGAKKRKSTAKRKSSAKKR